MGRRDTSVHVHRNTVPRDVLRLFCKRDALQARVRLHRLCQRRAARRCDATMPVGPLSVASMHDRGARRCGLDRTLCLVSLVRGRCKKTRCLMMYCSCFAGAAHCKRTCMCVDCANNSEHPRELFAAVQHAVVRSNVKDNGCQCVKSRCAKLYCMCLMQGRKCSPMCLCTECSNMPEPAAVVAQSARKPKKPAKRPAAALPSAPESDELLLVAVAPDPDIDADSTLTRPASPCPGRVQREVELPHDTLFLLDVTTCSRTALLCSIEERMGVRIHGDSA